MTATRTADSRLARCVRWAYLAVVVTYRSPSGAAIIDRPSPSAGSRETY